MNALEIPVTGRPQRFTIPLGSIGYAIRLHWLKPADCWVFDVMDRNWNPLINGIPLVTGANLIRQFQYLMPGIMFILNDSIVPDEVPDFTHLGVTGHVYWAAPITHQWTGHEYRGGVLNQ